jgi:5-(carboxyamino)imidazole ribonucleotide mutase
MLSMYDKKVADRLEKKRQQMTETVLESSEQLG